MQQLAYVMPARKLGLPNDLHFTRLVFAIRAFIETCEDSFLALPEWPVRTPGVPRYMGAAAVEYRKHAKELPISPAAAAAYVRSKFSSYEGLSPSFAAACREADNARARAVEQVKRGRG